MAEIKKIMICDDSILVRLQLSNLIKNNLPGVEITEASNGAEAIRKFDAVRPDLSFLDIVMPETDGIAATKGILALDADARVVIVSSVGTQNKLREAIEAGAKDFIQKPFSGEQIEKLLEFYSKEA